jgi:hypothetical protein
MLHLERILSSSIYPRSAVYAANLSPDNFQTLREFVGEKKRIMREMMSGKQGIITSSNDVSTKRASFKIDDAKQRRNK